MRKVPGLVLAVLGIAWAAEEEEPPTDARVQAMIAAHQETVRRLGDSALLRERAGIVSPPRRPRCKVDSDPAVRPQPLRRGTVSREPNGLDGRPSS